MQSSERSIFQERTWKVLLDSVDVKATLESWILGIHDAHACNGFTLTDRRARTMAHAMVEFGERFGTCDCDGPSALRHRYFVYGNQEKACSSHS
jgi:hypothetical protein